MKLDRLRVALVAVLVVLAGCAGGIPGGVEHPTEPTGPSSSSESGSVNFYVSDEENAIGDFEHLNVTITRVGFHYTGNGSDTGNESGEWFEHDVDERLVDLTELRGANATLLAAFDVPDGEYTKVFAYVDEVNGTLENGERTNVKLPSEKLQLTTPFTVGANESVDFVFDIAVHEAGKSGKYILKPVIGESGTDVPIERVDGDDREESDERDLRATFLSDVSAGENVTVEVTGNGTPVQNTTVTVDDETVGTTDADGRIVLRVPDEAEEFEVKVIDGENEVELEVEFEDRGDDDAGDGDDGDERAEADDEEDDLTASFTGQVEAGENVTIRVDRNGSAVENATVMVDDETVGTTDASGRLTFEAPDEAFDVTVLADDAEAALEVEFENGSGTVEREN